MLPDINAGDPLNFSVEVVGMQMIEPFLQKQLTQLARNVAEERNWPWREPLEFSSGVHEKEPVWIVRTNATMRGSNIRIVIRKSNQEVVHSGYLPR